MAGDIAGSLPVIGDRQRLGFAMKVRGANETIALIPQTNDGSIRIAGGVLPSGVIRHVIFLDLDDWHPRTSPLNVSMRTSLCSSATGSKKCLLWKLRWSPTEPCQQRKLSGVKNIDTVPS